MKRTLAAVLLALCLGTFPVWLGSGADAGPIQEESESGQEETAESEVSAELRRLYEADQADRRFDSPPTPEQWQEILVRDRARQARVMELVRAGELVTAEDYYHAAMVLQHGEGSEPILLAHILATVAGFKGHESGRWLSAAALDRYLHRIDQPQRLGTQYVRDSADEPWGQGAYEDWLPDSIREEYGVRPLGEQREYVEQMNQR